MADLDPESITKLRVVDLREQLSSRGLSTSGLKAELIKRLREAILNDDKDGGFSGQVKQSLHDDSERSSSEITDDSNDAKADRIDVDEMEGQEINRDDEEVKEVNTTKDERFRNEEEPSKVEQRKFEYKLRIEQEKLKEEQLRKEKERLRAEEEEKTQLGIEEERKAEEKELRIERQRKAEAERLRLAEEKDEKEHKLRIEQEKLKEEQLRKEKERLRKEEEEKYRLRIEEERKAEERGLRIERQRKAEAERLRMAEEKEHKLRIEQEKLKEEQLRKEKERLRREEEEKTRLRIEEEKKTEEKWLRIERQRKAEAERLRMAEEERIRIESEKKSKADRLRREAEMKAEEEQSRIQLERIAEKERVTAEEEKYKAQAEKEMLRAANQHNKEDRRHVEEELKKTERERLRFFEERRLKKISKSRKVEEELLKAEENWKMMEEEGQTYDDGEENMDTNETPTDIKLPQALEKVLALKTERAQLLGVDPDSVVQPDSTNEEKSTNAKGSVVSLVTVEEDDYVEEESISNKNKDSRNKRRKKKKKKRNTERMDNKKDVSKRSESSTNKGKHIDIDIEYVQEVMDISDPLYSQFMKIFERFKLTDYEKEKEEMQANAAKDVSKEETMISMALRKKAMDLDDDDDDDGDDDDKKEEEKPKLSKRKLKKLSRMTVAELKQKVNRPELVEMHDVTAKDPVLLLHLKASRNTVPVPRHWCFKRKYLQGKRGIEKPAFELPDFIKRTGIMEMRQALQEKEDQKTMKAKMRERVRPKLGKIDIDYQKLHDAFFKWQTKPRMTIHGDLYYEGKEFETRLKEKKPGDLSDDLRTALGMPTGPNANKCPPPWLIAMQRYGPPPSYPNLKIPGLNAPIPDSCSFGYHAGGWGKPPVDETGRPLYGDVFGTQIIDNQPHIQEEEIDHTLWGELESESSEEEEEDEDEEEEEEEEKAEDESGLVTPAEGLITPSGFSSIPAGMETPDMIELRKRKIESEMEGGETPALYTILPEKKTERVGAAMMGSTHIYDLAGAIPGSKLKMPGTASVPPQGIEVALDPSELEMDTAAMAARYEQTMREQQSQLEKEDLSDMVAEHAARQKNKRKKQQMDSAKPPKKYKEFKF